MIYFIAQEKVKTKHDEWTKNTKVYDVSTFLMEALRSSAIPTTPIPLVTPKSMPYLVAKIICKLINLIFKTTSLQNNKIQKLFQSHSRVLHSSGN